MKDFKTIIYEWVKENFGQSEADDPSWSIEALAEELEKSKFDIYRAVERGFLRDDCEEIAERNNIKLTDEEKELVIDEYMNSEAYVDAHEEDWLWFMGQVKRGEQNNERN